MSPLCLGLDKLSGVFSKRSQSEPYVSAQSVPLILILQNRLGYTLNSRELKAVLVQRILMVNGKVRQSARYRVGYQDVIGFTRLSENFRLSIDAVGRYSLLRIPFSKAIYKLCSVSRVKLLQTGLIGVLCKGNVFFVLTGLQLRAGDSILWHISDGLACAYTTFIRGNLCIVVGGGIRGRIGSIMGQSSYAGCATNVTIASADGARTNTLKKYCFVIGKGDSLLLA